MRDIFAKAIFIGIPLVLSVSWFLYWVIRLCRFQRRKEPPVLFILRRPEADARPKALESQ
jgi:hypothetical protein